jgi:two-component system chemotaxis response regulator CheY
MIHLDNELAQVYLAECGEHLNIMEKNLLAIEPDGAGVDEEIANAAFRAVHSVKDGAGLFELTKIRELAHQAEHAMALIRSRKMVPTPNRVSVLLRATDTLRALVDNPGASNQADISAIVAALAGLSADSNTSATPRRGVDWRLRALLVEDDFTSRLLLQTFLSRYGDCHIAVNGREAVAAVREALELGQSYDLICMDIMMPEMDGREAVRQIRAMEEGRGILSTHGSKIVMTTAVQEIKEVMRCFRDLCDAYLVKPIDLAQLVEIMKAHNLVGS